MEGRNISTDEWGEMEIPSQLQELLPGGYSYRLKKWTPFENQSSHFEAIILTNVYTEEEAQEWWHEFNVKSNTTMRVRATCPKTGKVNTFKIYLRCLHQGRAEKSDKTDLQNKSKNSAPAKRNTGCPAGMIIAIRRLVKYSRSKTRDPVDPVRPCEIHIRFIHNHPTNGADSLRFRPVSKETEEKLLSLYQIGHSPSSALETLKVDLQIEYGTSYAQIAADRYHCPDKSYCYRIYYKHFGKEYASAAKKDIGSTLTSKVSQYNTEFRDTCVSIGASGTDYAVAVCTPLMKRAHTLPQSSNMVYIELSESSGNKEKAEHYVFLLLAHTAAGGVPLGAVVTTSNTASVLTMGFQLLQQLLPEQAFCGRGTVGPHAFLIEESENQRIAVHSMWGESVIIQCIFRVLQSMWRWLWDDKHNIHKDHRLYLLYLVKTLLYASSELEMANKYRALCVDNITSHYPMYLQQAESLWQRRHYWGICFHRLLPLEGANNYYEAAVRALKDKAFEQTKTFSFVQLVNFVITRLDAYYKNKLLAIVHNRVDNILRCHYSSIVPPVVDENIKQVAGNYFLVPSEFPEDKIYTVDVELNTCTCSVGIGGAFCRHQYWIFLKMPNTMFMVSFMKVELREKLQTIATGSSEPLGAFQTGVCLPEDNVSQSNCDSTPHASVLEVTSVVDSMFSHPNLHHNFPLPGVAVISNVADCNAMILSQPAESIPHNISQDADENLVQNSESDINEPLDEPEMSSNQSSPSREVYCTVKNIKKEETNNRMVEVEEKFEHFCQRVKEGMKTQPKDFLPAVEIMMKNLERKGNSSDLLVSGLSFFGVLAAPSLSIKERKRPPSVGPFVNEILPQVHGRQMITYGKRRIVSSVSQSNSAAGILIAETSHSSNMLDDALSQAAGTHPG